MNTPFGMVIERDCDRFIDPELELARCHDKGCPGFHRGFLFDAETELCPFCCEEGWS